MDNKFLYESPDDFLNFIVKLVNLSLKQGIIPENCKKSLIIMIYKGKLKASDPSNYRPISLTRCLSKFVEGFVKDRLKVLPDI